MPWLHDLVDYGVLGLLLLMSIIAIAIAIERYLVYRAVRPDAFATRKELELHLSRKLHLIATIGANAPYIGLLGTVLGIMLTFEALGSSGAMDVKTIMVGLALALKATAVGIGVAIPCVGLNNALRRLVRVKLAEFDEAQGG